MFVAEALPVTISSGRVMPATRTAPAPVPSSAVTTDGSVNTAARSGSVMATLDRLPPELARATARLITAAS